MLLNKSKLRTSPGNEFQNRGPEYAIIQFSKLNIFKTSTIWFALFIAFAAFGFSVSSFSTGDVNYQISELGATISLWGLIAFVLLLWFFSYTRRFNYALSLLNYLHIITLTLVFIGSYLLYKLGFFGAINNSKINYQSAVQAIRTLFYTWMSFYFFLTWTWYLVTFLSRNKYKYAFTKASFLVPIINLFLLTPFLIARFNNAFDAGAETTFLVIASVLIISFSIAMGFLSKYQTVGETNLKIVNRVFGSEISYATFGALAGGFAYQTYWSFSSLQFTLFTIISLVISAAVVLFFTGFILRRRKRPQNSFLNKIISKMVILILLVATALLVYLSGSKFSVSVSIVVPALLAILTFFLLTGSVFKLVVFERWPMITKVANSAVAFFFIFLQALVTTLEDGKIIYDWLGHFLIIFILSFYIFVEISALLPELFTVLLAAQKQPPGPGQMERSAKDEI